MNYRVLTLLVLCVPLFLSGCDENKPTRSQCITKIDFIWPESANAQYLMDLNNRMADVFNKGLKESNIDSFAGFSLPKSRHDSVYIQYKKDCKEKQENTRRLFSYFEEKIEAFPRYEISDEVVIPGMSTINLFGPSWVNEYE